MSEQGKSTPVQNGRKLPSEDFGLIFVGLSGTLLVAGSAVARLAYRYIA